LGEGAIDPCGCPPPCHDAPGDDDDDDADYYVDSSASERDDVTAEQTSFRANERLLSVLGRKSADQFQLFLDALDCCGQTHVRDAIDQKRGSPTEKFSVLFDIHKFAKYGG